MDRVSSSSRKAKARFPTDDRLSQLPDELLITILSSTLTMKEAGRTCILSKRWKTLWTYYHGFLDFDTGINIPLSQEQLFRQSTAKYIRYVNKVLHSHRGFGTPVNKLKLCWRMDCRFKTVIDSWIELAMQKSVRHFELDLWLPTTDGYYQARFQRPRFGFPNLTALRFNFVDVTDETFHYLVSPKNCPSLQHISIQSADSLVHVKVASNLKLKTLEFSCCWKMEDLEICSALNLVSFRFKGPEDTNITFENVPLLTEALFGGHYIKNIVMIPRANVKLISSILSRLETLVLDFVCLTSYLVRISWEFPKFDAVKHLEVQVYAPRPQYLNLCLMSMIYGCPRLQKFSLKVFCGGRPCGRELGRFVPKKNQYQRRHECLEVVECNGGWDGNEDDLQLIANLVENAVLLEKVIIDPRTVFKFREPLFSKDQEFVISDKKREEVARKAAEKLRTNLPEGVSLVIK